MQSQGENYKVLQKERIRIAPLSLVFLVHAEKVQTIAKQRESQQPKSLTKTKYKHSFLNLV
tara:strand:+ start:521 stop:703 length:183 start_codon:yes stop_codon:yes gene_type:complete